MSSSPVVGRPTSRPAPQRATLTALGCIMLGGLVGCATLKQTSTDLSIQSYRYGCILRSQQHGVASESAEQLCDCHIDDAIAQTSPEQFLDYVQRVNDASRAERDSGKLAVELQLIRSTFKRCREQLRLDADDQDNDKE